MRYVVVTHRLQRNFGSRTFKSLEPIFVYFLQAAVLLSEFRKRCAMSQRSFPNIASNPRMPSENIRHSCSNRIEALKVSSAGFKEADCNIVPITCFASHTCCGIDCLSDCWLYWLVCWLVKWTGCMSLAPSSTMLLKTGTSPSEEENDRWQTKTQRCDLHWNVGTTALRSARYHSLDSLRLLVEFWA